MPRREPKQRHDSNTPEEIRDLWRTPPEVIAAVNEIWPLGRDVAASPHNAVCARYYTEEQNSLVQSWALPAGEWNWCNPPYSNIAPWVVKMMGAAASEGSGTLLFVPQDFSIQWARRLVCGGATAYTLVNGRVDFINESTGKPVDQNNKGTVLWVMDPLNLNRPQPGRYIDLPSLLARGQYLLDNQGAQRLAPHYITP